MSREVASESQVKELSALMRSRLKCLRIALKETVGFLRHNSSHSLSTILALEEVRANALRSAFFYDEKIEKIAQDMTRLSVSSAQRESIRKIYQELETTLSALRAVDPELITAIEKFKNEMTRDLGQIKRDQQTIAKFKSTWVQESGDGLDQKI